MPSADTPHAQLRARLREFRETDPRESWRLLGVTVALLAVAWTAALSPLLLPVRIAASLATGGLLLRLCSFGHDYLHGALLARSAAARGVFSAVGALVLAPPRVWRDTHNFHHAHNGRLPVTAIGTFPLLTAREYRAAPGWKRAAYRVARSPAAMLLAWPALFVVGLNLRHFLRHPVRYLSSGVALALHGLMHVLVWTHLGPLTWALALALPYTVMSAAGAYLFYVQHNFPGAAAHAEDAWDLRDAALSSSSYMALPPWLHWFTGNIGYHHIHHFDPRVPFYRLPRAFAEIPAFTRAADTSARLSAVRAAFALVAWDEERGRMITAAELR